MVSFAVASFGGAFLLFLVQPLIGKYILPWFGGGPGVWTTCLLFFQCGLLAGYAYAHLLTRFLPSRSQVVFHLALLAAAVALLPITPGEQLKPSGGGEPTWEVLSLLGRTVGLPYLALAATAPLLQAWFSRVHPGRSPYRLYALSNVGSLLALVSYPVLVETTLPRPDQTRWWSAGLLVFALACAWCGLGVWRRPADAGADSSATVHAAEDGPTRGRIWLWLSLPACGTVLLMATTNKITQDVSVVPFLWVVPLGLYLLSFILSFDSPRWYSRTWYAWALLPCWGGVYGVLDRGVEAPISVQVVVYSVTLFVTCMVCHGELYRLRPAPRRLTAYYLTISAGGAVGGLFVALMAPLIFDSYSEFHWGLLASGVLLAVVCFRGRGVWAAGRWWMPSWVPVSLAVCLLGWGLWLQALKVSEGAGPSTRSFYGVLTLFDYDAEDPDNHYRLLRHGRIAHGLQFTNPVFARLATTYFTEESGVGLAMRLTRAEGKRVGVVGLGVGTLAAYGRPGDYYRFYEINPAVVRLSGPAGDTFTYLKDSEARIEIALGDARLSMEREPPQRFDVLVLDAFSSDSIPVHLLTREAFETYRRHLRPDGVIAVHIANRYLDLEPVVLTAARHLGLQALIINGEQNDEDTWIYPSAWVLLTSHRALIEHPDIRGAVSPPKPGVADIPLWTDDYTSVFAILDDKLVNKLGELLRRANGAGRRATAG